MWYLKDDILNRLIQFLLKHCYLYCSTIYAFVNKLPYDEAWDLFEEIDDYSEHVNNVDAYDVIVEGWED